MSANYIYYNYATSQVCTVKEERSSYICSRSVEHYFDELCILHGSTLEGRKKAFSKLMEQKNFIPVVVQVHPHEIYFPIKPMKDPQNIWICYEEIASIEQKNKTCVIHFKDQTCLECEHPQRIKKQMHQIFRFLKRKDI